MQNQVRDIRNNIRNVKNELSKTERLIIVAELSLKKGNDIVIENFEIPEILRDQLKDEIKIVSTEPNPKWQELNEELSSLEESLIPWNKEKEAREIARLAKVAEKRARTEEKQAREIARLAKVSEERAKVAQEQAKVLEERAQEKRRNKNHYAVLDF